MGYRDMPPPNSWTNVCCIWGNHYAAMYCSETSSQNRNSQKFKYSAVYSLHLLLSMNCRPNSENAMLCYDPLESDFGDLIGPKVHGAPTTSWWGGAVCPPAPLPSPASPPRRLPFLLGDITAGTLTPLLHRRLLAVADPGLSEGASF